MFYNTWIFWKFRFYGCFYRIWCFENFEIFGYLEFPSKFVTSDKFRDVLKNKKTKNFEVLKLLKKHEKGHCWGAVGVGLDGWGKMSSSGKIGSWVEIVCWGIMFVGWSKKISRGGSVTRTRNRSLFCIQHIKSSLREVHNCYFKPQLMALINFGNFSCCHLSNPLNSALRSIMIKIDELFLAAIIATKCWKITIPPKVTNFGLKGV